MTHAQKPDFVFRRKGRVHLNRRGSQFSRLLAAEVCASALVMLDTTTLRGSVRVLATHSIRQFPLHFPSRASPCAIRFQTSCTIHIGSNKVSYNLLAAQSAVPQLSCQHICSADGFRNIRILSKNLKFWRRFLSSEMHEQEVLKGACSHYVVKLPSD